MVWKYRFSAGVTHGDNKTTYFKTQRYLCWCFAVSPVSGHWSICCAESSFRFYKYEKIVTMTLIFKALSLNNGNLLSPLQRGEADWLLDIHCLQGHQGHSAYLTQATPTLAYVPSTGRVSTSPPLYRYALRAAVELAVALNAVNLATPLTQISSLRLAPFDLSSYPPLLCLYHHWLLLHTDLCRGNLEEHLPLLMRNVGNVVCVTCSASIGPGSVWKHLCGVIRVLHKVVFMQLVYSYTPGLGIDPVVPLVNHLFLYV